MNKGKIIGLSAAVVLLLAVIGVGIFTIFGKKTVETTEGNRLDVEWYDVNAKEFTITTADELYEISALSSYYNFKGQTIKLGADIVVNEGNATDWAKEAPERKWSPINGFGGVFDGQGHTISGLYATGYDAPIALFSNTMSGAEIKNFKLTNTYFESTGFGGVASISSNGGGKFKQIYSDAILAVVGSYSGYSGGICSKLNLQSSVEECWFDGVINTTGRDAGGIVDNVLGCRVTISHCLFSGEINSTWDYSGTRTGGLVGRVYKTGAALVLEDSLAAGKINAANVYYTGSVLGASMGSTSLTTTNTFGSKGAYDVAIGRSGSNGTINSAPLELREQELTGTKAYEWTNLDFDKYWAIVEEDTPILQCFAEEVPSTAGLQKAFDTSWYMEGAIEYVISDLADLYGLYYLGAGNTFQGKTIKLAADIVINEGKAADWVKEENAPENVWYPVSKFSGTLDGQGHTINGMYINTSGEYVGLFKQTTYDAVVKNLNVKNSYMYNSSTANVFMGTISGRGGGTFDTIYADTIITSYGSIVGGIFGQVNLEAKNTFTNCWFDGSIDMKGETARYAGGIAAGAVKGNTSFEHCLNTAPISQLDFKDAGMFVGGIAGYIINNNVVGSITDCLNTGKISVNYHVCVGSIVGRLNKAAVTLTDTYATTESYTYSDGTFRGIGTSSNSYTGGVANLPEELISGKGGYQWTTLNFKDYWTIVTGPDDTPVLKTFANKVPSVAGIAKKIDTSWYNADKKEFVLKDLDDLYGFYIISGFDTFLDKTVKLGADITVNSGNASDWATKAPANQWFPIQKFKGTFDGQGHTISGIYLKTDQAYSGLFSTTTKESTVKNLKLTNSYFESTIKEDMAAHGSVAGQMGGILDTVYSDSIVVGYGKQIGGLAGRINHGALIKYKMSNCWFDGSVNVHNETATMAYIGGLAGGLIQGYLDMDNCLNTGSVTYTFDKLPTQADGSTHYIGTHVGGLMGGVMNGTQYNKEDGSLKRVSEWNVSDAMNAGVVTSGKKDGSYFANGAGSIFGYSTSGTINFKGNVYATPESCPVRVMQYNTKKATVTGAVTKVPEATILGTKGYQNTLLNFDKYWSARSAQVPALKSFVGSGLSLANAWRPDTSFMTKNAGTAADPYVIKTIQQLYGLATVVNNGNTLKDKTIKLGADIDVNKGWVASASEPENVWTPISKFAGTFDGNGKTISGIYLKTSSANAGLFAQTTDTSTIKNFKLTNSYFYSDADNARLGSVVGNLGGTLDTVYSSAIVEGTMDQIGGLVGVSNDLTNRTEGIVTITNCWFDGTVSVTNKEAQLAYVGGVVGGVIQGTLNMDNCLNTGAISYEYDKMPEGTVRTGVATGGLVGGVMNGVRKDTGKGTKSVLNISDSLNTGSVQAKTSAGAEHPYNDGVRSVVGYTTAGTVTIKENVYATSESASGTIHYNNDRAVVSGSANTLAEASLLGTKGYTYTLLDFDAYWSARSADVPALKSFVGAGIDVSTAWRPDTDWAGSGTKTDPYVISTIGELYGFAQAVNDGNSFAGEFITLGKSIDLNEGWTAGASAPENIWTPIGSLENPFKGTFDGKMFTISGLYMDTSKSYAGLFGYAQECTIQNFYLKNSYFNTTASSAYLGSVMGYGDGTFANIYSNAILNSTGAQQGGLIGRVQRGNNSTIGPNTVCTITNCWYDGTINASYNTTIYTGGLTGFAVYGKTTIENCLFTGKMNIEYTGTGSAVNLSVGGFTPQNNGDVGKITIKNSLSAGTINITQGGTTEIRRAGAVMGYARNAAVLTNVYATTDFSHAVGATEAGADVEVTALKKENLLGVKGYQMTMLDFDQHWSARTDKVPALTTFVGQGLDLTGVVKMDTSWVDDAEGTAVDPYLIEDIQDMYGLASLVNGGEPFTGKTFKLVNDLDFNENWTASATEPQNVWEPIGSCTNVTGKTGNYFAGTFDGNDKTIKGLYVNSTTGTAGLFGFTVDSTIRDLRIENSYMASSFADGVLGSFVGYGEGNLINLYSNATLVSDKIQVGGLIGRIQDKTGSGAATADITDCNIVNCQFSGVITSTNAANATVGGLVGAAIYGTTNIQNCIFDGQITAASTAKRVGGLIGQDNATSTTVTIENCVVAGSVAGADKKGAVIGRVGKQTTIKSSVYVSNTYTIDIYGELNNTDGSLVSAVKVDFTNASALAATINALNVNVKANNDSNVAHVTWKTWNKENGLPVFGEAPTGEFIDVTPDIEWEGEGTAEKPYLIQTPGELYGLAQEVNGGNKYTGKYFKVTKDIKVNVGSSAEWASSGANNVWTPIGYCDSTTNKTGKPFEGNFDGNNKTINGLYVNETAKSVGLFGYAVDGVIENVILENCYMASTFDCLAGLVGYGDGTFKNIRIKDTVIFEASGIQNGGIIGRVQDGTASKADSYAESNCSIINCWVSAKINSTNTGNAATGGLVGAAIYGTTTIDNSIFDGQIAAASTAKRVGGLIGNDNGTTTTVTVKNTVVAGSVSGATKMGSIIGRTGKQTTVDVSVYVSSNYTIDMYGELNSTDGSLIKAVKTDFTAAGKLADTLLALNTKANANDGWDNWVPCDGKPVLEQFAPKLETIDVTPDTSWLSEGAGTEADPYILIDAADLYGLASISTSKTYNAFAEKHFKLGANIQLNDGNAEDWAATNPVNTWTKAIGNNSYKFNGVFDGNNMTISGFYSKSATPYMGLFGYTQTTCTIKNLRIENSYFEYTGTSNAILGAVAGQGAGEFDNIYSDAILVSTHNYVGGIIGDVNKGGSDTHTIKNCWFNGSIQMKGDAIYAGGITGVAMQGTVNISNCLNTGSISSERTAGVNIGGIVGCAHNDVKLNITNCVNAGPFTVNLDSCVGAIVSRTGVSSSKKATVTVKNSYMTGDSYTKYDVGTNGTGQYGTGHETSTYVADAATIVTSLNTSNNATVWVAKTVNGKTIPVLVSLQDLAE